MDEHEPPDPRPRGAPAAAGGPIVAGRYRVERLIARGGMAAVFLAEHIALRRRVALKILHPPPDAEESGNFEKRFRLEAETLATLDHPNIVTMYDYGEAEDGRFYLAMEYIEGPRFTDLLGAGALPPDRAIRLILEVCAALRYAHKRGVIHRDLKPSNLLIGTDSEGGERVKVVDFGLVKVAEIDQALTREGLVLGSPHCMAPEQVRGANIDHRADIYAIGVLLFRSLTGVYPFHGATSTATMVAHLNEPIPTFAAVAPALRVPARLEDVVRRCLAKRQADRYPDVNALMEDLTACIGLPPGDDTRSATAPAAAEPVSATTAILPEPVPPTRSRAPVVIWIVFAALALAVGTYVLGTSGGAPPAAPPSVAAPLPPPTAPTADPAAPTGAAVDPAAPAGAAGDPQRTAAPADPAAPTGAAADPAAPTPADPAAPTAAPTADPRPPKPATVRTGTPAARPTGTSKPATDAAKPENPEGYMPLPDDFK